jgi:large subunit ribosomal protein L3
MLKFIIGKKVGMTTIYDSAKGALNITLVECLPNKIELIRNEEKDGYDAVCLGLTNKKGKITSKEFRIDSEEKANFEVGKEIGVDIFEIDEKVKVSGITKGRGYQGVVKRHGFKGGRRSHGQKHSERESGSIGVGGIQRVQKGTRMAGRMGADRVTVKNLKIAKIDSENNLLYVKGAVPGRKGTLVEIKG